MILYTIMPNELVYPVETNLFENQQCVEVNGVSMIVERNEEYEYRIVRLLSTNPEHYLSADYSPGMTIKLS
ncbi:ribonuclease [Bacillus sp. BGMRC 2118]|nr:ribonuclease [Bacillus sp. BGMRC 2118]